MFFLKFSKLKPSLENSLLKSPREDLLRDKSHWSIIRYVEQGGFHEKESLNGSRMCQTHFYYLWAKETGSWNSLNIYQYDWKKKWIVWYNESSIEMVQSMIHVYRHVSKKSTWGKKKLNINLSLVKSTVIKMLKPVIQFPRILK